MFPKKKVAFKKYTKIVRISKKSIYFTDDEEGLPGVLWCNKRQTSKSSPAIRWLSTRTRDSRALRNFTASSQADFSDSLKKESFRYHFQTWKQLLQLVQPTELYILVERVLVVNSDRKNMADFGFCWRHLAHTVHGVYRWSTAILCWTKPCPPGF